MELIYIRKGVCMTNADCCEKVCVLAVCNAAAGH